MGQALKNIQRRREACRRLEELINNASHVFVIHYSCESFYDRPDGSSPRITSIATRNLASGQTKSFSIHQMAERTGHTKDELEKHYDELEKAMLSEFYDYARAHSSDTWLHWNMRDINYGFEAIAHRYRVLGGEPFEIPEANRVDLARLLVSRFGKHYIGHPRLESLVKRNNMSSINFLPGKEEAVAFQRKEYVRLHQSTLRKADLIADIIERAEEGNLKTNARLNDIYGTYFAALGELIKEHWVFAILGLVLAIIGLIISLL